VNFELPGNDLHKITGLKMVTVGFRMLLIVFKLENAFSICL